MSDAAASRATDTDLTTAAAGGDAGAFEEIVRRHAGLVLGLGRRLLPDRSEAEDLVQEVFLRVHRGLPQFRGAASLKTWITHVTVNAARNRHRSARRRGRDRTVSLDAARSDDCPPLAEVVPDVSAGPERLALASEARRRIESALDVLPLEFREAVVLREIEGLAYDEIAAALDISVGTVKSRIARARSRLQEQLADLIATRPGVSR